MNAYLKCSFIELRKWANQQKEREIQMSKISELLEFIGDREIKLKEAADWYVAKNNCNIYTAYRAIDVQLKRKYPTLKKIQRVDNFRNVTFLKRISQNESITTN